MRKDKAQVTAPRSSSRRSMLKGAMVGTAGIAGVAGVAAAGIYISERDKLGAAHASGLDSSYYHGSSPDSIQTIINIAVTAETLAVIFYTEVIAHANILGFGAAGLADIVAAQVEEELHREFLVKQGAQALTTTFSFPHGANTFRHFDLFIKTQQWLEALFIAAYILAGKEFAMLGRPDLVQVAAQIGGVEAEHRAIGRAIGGLRPANNLVFESVFINKVSDAATLLKKNGFLSPSYGNSFTFKAGFSMNTSGLSMMSSSDSDVPSL
jgi:Ferritin-like domain